MLMVCTGTGCVAARGFSIRDKLLEVIKAKGLEKDYLVVGTGCNGFCAMGPIVVVQPDGIFYQKIQEKDVEQLVQSHLVEGTTVKELMHTDAVSGELKSTWKRAASAS